MFKFEIAIDERRKCRYNKIEVLAASAALRYNGGLSMQINREYEQEIDLKDWFFDIVYHWRSILIAALIGAVLLGAYQFASIEMTHRAGKQTKEDKQFEIDLQDYQDSVRLARSNIRTYTQQMAEKNRYMDESVYMSLDSQNEWMAIRNYFIRMDSETLTAQSQGLSEDMADYVATAYASSLKSGLDADEMVALLGTSENDYIDELVSIEPDPLTNSFTLTVIGESREIVEKQMDYFADRLETVCGPQAQQVGAHTLVLVSQDVYSRTDSDLSAKQDEINTDLTKIQEKLKQARETLNELEEKEEPKAPGNHIKRFAAIGFLAGAFLLAVIYAVKYVLDGKLHTPGEIAEKYEIPVFGAFARSRARRPGKGLDKLFEKWEFGHSGVDDAAILNGIAALLEGRYSGKRVLLTGTLPQSALDGLMARLKPVLGAVDVETQANFLTNREAVSAAGKADAIVLVEERYASKIRDIDRAAEMLMIGDADVGGCVII